MGYLVPVTCRGCLTASRSHSLVSGCPSLQVSPVEVEHKCDEFLLPLLQDACGKERGSGHRGQSSACCRDLPLGSPPGSAPSGTVCDTGVLVKVWKMICLLPNGKYKVHHVLGLTLPSCLLLLAGLVLFKLGKNCVTASTPTMLFVSVLFVLQFSLQCLYFNPP